MRHNPGSIYFIAYNTANVINMWNSMFFTAIIYYNIDPASNNVSFCKVFFYIRLVLFVLTPYYLVLNSIDRTLVTSSNTRTRERSSLRLAYWSIGVVTLVLLLFYTQALVFINIYPIYIGYSVCYIPPGNYRLFMSISAFVLNGVLPSVLLTMFGILTLRNLRRGCIQPVNAGPTTNNTHRSKDRQLAMMLLVEIISYIPFNLSHHIFSMYRHITQYQIKSLQQQAMELFLFATFYLFTFIPSAISFYLYLAVSKAFRQKTIKMLCKLCQHRSMHNSQHQSTTGTAVANHSIWR